MKTIAFVVLSALIIFNLTHVYFNIFSHSLPYGLYIKIDGIPRRDNYAASCLTPSIAGYGMVRHYLEPGACRSGSVLVLKMVKGLPGDRYLIKDGALVLNGKLYPISKTDSLGRPLKVFYSRKPCIIEKGQYFLLSTFAKNSWDGRYWGPVTIDFLLRPLWIFEHVK